jgi:hypothetical protein
MPVLTNLYSDSWKRVLSGANLCVRSLKQRAVEASTRPCRAITLKFYLRSAWKFCYMRVTKPT